MSGPSPELLATCEQFLAGYTVVVDNRRRELHLFGPQLAAWVHAREQAAVQLALEEHEAALCPEDYGCKEYITYLKRKIDALAQPAAEPPREHVHTPGAISECCSCGWHCDMIKGPCERQWKEHIK